MRALLVVVAVVIGVSDGARALAQAAGTRTALFNSDASAPPPPEAATSPPDAAAPPPDAGPPAETGTTPPAPPPPPTMAPSGGSRKAEGDGRATGASNNKEEAPNEEGEALEEVAPRPNAKGDPFGDEGEAGRKPRGFSFRLLLQTRYTRVFDDASIQDAESNDGFSLNRAFLRATVHPYRWLSSKVLVDFAELAYSNPEQALKLAYGELRPWKRLELTVGLFKRTYSLLELLPIAQYELADTGPTDNMIKLTQFGGRDVGAMVRGDPLPRRRWLHVYVGAFGGAGEGAEGIPGTTGSPNTGPDLAAPSLLLTSRLMSRPLKHLSLGADAAWRPRGTTEIGNLPPQSQVTSGVATSADATYSNRFFELRGEWLWGDRTDVATRGEARTFMGAWGIVAVRFPIARVLAMPALRLEWLDADREHPERRHYLASGALNLDVTPHVRVLLDLTRDQLSTGSLPSTSIPGIFDHNATVFVTQVQLKI